MLHSFVPEPMPGRARTGPTSLRSVHRPAAALAVALFALDVVFPAVNLSILYVVPLMLAAGARRGRGLGPVVALLVALTFAGLALKTLLHYGVNGPLGYRLVNRTLVTLLLVQLGGILRNGWGPNRGDEDDTGADDPFGDGHFGGLSFRSLAALTISAVATAGLLVADFLAPHDVNLPILYSVLLFVVSWTERSLMLWVAAAALLALTFAEPLWALTAGGNAARVVWINRSLAAAVLVVVAGALQFAMCPHRAH